MTEPKLVLIPSAYKAGTLYSPLPSNGDGDFTFSRTTTATRVNKDGLIEVVGNGVPRIDYSDSSCPSLLLEPTRSNLQVNSEEFDNSLWIKQRASITPNDAISPSGLLNADKLMGTSGASSYVYDGVSVVSGSVYTISVFVKYIDISQFSIVNFTQSGKANFNIENGTVTSNSATLTEPKIENYGNGWYRCSVKFTATANASVNYGFILDNAIDKSVHIWGAQFELGNFSTSYIPTTTSAATRSEDSGVLDNLSYQDDMTFYVEGYADNDAAGGTIYIYDKNNILMARFYINSSGNSNIRNEQIPEVAFGVDNGVNNKLAFKINNGEVDAFINGIKYPLSNITLQGLSKILLRGVTNALGGNCFVRKILAYDTALTDAELIELTTL